MKNIHLFALLVLLATFSFCNRKSSDENFSQSVNTANAFIDAFYSFDPDSLQWIMRNAPESQPSILYYQKWAECGNYEVLKRAECFVRNDTQVICPVTVKDDLIGALKLDIHVTDTFHLTIIDGQIRTIQTSSNDPEMYYEAKAWVKEHRPELISEASDGIPNPCEYVKGMVKGFEEYQMSKVE